MNSLITSMTPGRSACLGKVLLLVLLLPTVIEPEHLRAADSRYTVVQPTPGGLSAHPDITSITRTNLEVFLKWNGFAGPYQLETRPSLDSGSWQPVGIPTDSKSGAVPLGALHAFLRVNGKPPPFTGAETCAECHAQRHANWSQTRHAMAFETLKAIGQDKNSSCIVCHTVGYGIPSGFIDENSTPYFKGVQCESCHGPAGDHANDPDNLALRPIITPSAMMCGGCHNGFHHPTYDEWKTAGHSHVTPTPAAYFLNPTNGVSRMHSCGSCHSGSVRLAMLDWAAKGTLVMPSGPEAAEVSVTCTVCHDSHVPNLDNTHSLRNPRYSTNFFSYSTASSTTFTNQYNANIQLCGQCHNMRGAQPGDTGRAPHHSPQYNLLIGDVGVALGYVPPSTEQSPHRTIQDQCTRCHTHAHPVENPTIENPNYTGHGFAPELHSCVDCHTDEATAGSLKAATQADTRQRIQEVKNLLDSWGSTKSPDALRAKYGSLAWEYTAPGQISNPTGSSAIKGPTQTEQADVHLDIKKARMYLYLVEHDGSFGVHNTKYTRFLLNQAKTNVMTLLATP